FGGQKFALPCAAQQQHSHSVGCILVAKPGESFGQPGNFGAGQILCALMLLIAFDATAGIVGAPAPADREAQHPRQHCDCSICVRRSAGAEPVVETVNVRMRDSSNLHLAEGGQDVGSDLLPVDPLGRWPLAREIVPLESRADVGNGGGCSVLLLLANGISAAVDGALESFGFLACRSGAPIGERPNGVAAVAPGELAAG